MLDERTLPQQPARALGRLELVLLAGTGSHQGNPQPDRLGGQRHVQRNAFAAERAGVSIAGSPASRTARSPSGAFFLIRWSHTGRSAVGYHTATGVPSAFLKHFKSNGVDLPSSIFQPATVPPASRES
jgi:hypothetical protein